MCTVNRWKALGVRLALVLHFVLVVWRVTISWDDHYWLLLAASAPMFVEGLYNIVKQKGVEWKLFSLCFFFYLGATLPGIWLLEIKKTLTYQNSNTTAVETISVSGIDIPVRLSPDTWVLVVEEMMLYFMIIGRWLLPRGEVGREQLTQLLFGFIGIASDIMELFSLFDEDPKIRHNTLLTYVILGVWSLSVLQFTLTFATAHRPRRARGLRMSPEDFHNEEKMHRRSVLRVELLATFLSLFMQDGPFLSVRLYTILTYDVVTYSLVFFTAKNVLVILLLVYKIFLLLNKICCPKKAHTGENDDLKQLDMGVFGYEQEYIYDDDDYENVVVRVPKNMLKNGQVLDGHFGDLRHRGHQGKTATSKPQVVVPETAGDFDKKKLEKKDGRVWREPEDMQSAMYRPNRELDRGDTGEPLGFDMGTGFVGELQKVIDGPSTPAKKMEKTKKYDKLMVEDDSSAKNKEGEKDAKGTENSPTLDPSRQPNGKSNTGKVEPQAVNANEEGKEAQSLKPSRSFITDKEVNEALGDLDGISDDSGHSESPTQETDLGRPTARPSQDFGMGAYPDTGVRPAAENASSTDEPMRRNGGPTNPREFVSVINIKI